jgi:ATP-dependent HslUV protease ATP-binding subunit HslU
MAIFLPGERSAIQAGLSASPADLTPRQIVAELDRYIVGQENAKRAVAIALRNRTRRLKLSPEMAEEVAPKNIIMIGPTGVGKTEIARRLARLTNSPFIKVEASKFTEVGYVGRDVESMVRDLTDLAVALVREEKASEVRDRARANIEERLLNILLPAPSPASSPEPSDTAEQYQRSREKLRQQLREGLLEDRVIEVEVRQDQFPGFRIFGAGGLEELDVNLQDSMAGLFGSRTRRRRMSVRDSREVLQREEEEKLVDHDAVKRLAVERVEQSGIVFIDEIDKVAGRERGSGPEVSREGVQRDLLPLVEGTSVNTKNGMVRTDHILFIASGAFHATKPSDLLPELQGRFPILTEPKNALVQQYRALLLTEGIELDFTEDAIVAIADLAAEVNESSENIGARRLHTVMEKLLDVISFEAPDMTERKVAIDATYVRDMLSQIVKDQDLSRYIL